MRGAPHAAAVCALPSPHPVCWCAITACAASRRLAPRRFVFFEDVWASNGHVKAIREGKGEVLFDPNEPNAVCYKPVPREQLEKTLSDAGLLGRFNFFHPRLLDCLYDQLAFVDAGLPWQDWVRAKKDPELAAIVANARAAAFEAAHGASAGVGAAVLRVALGHRTSPADTGAEGGAPASPSGSSVEVPGVARNPLHRTATVEAVARSTDASAVVVNPLGLHLRAAGF